MDAIQLLEAMGEVPPADDITIDAAADLVLTAACQEGSFSPLASPTIKRRRRRRMAVGGAAVAAAAAVLAVVTLLPVGGAGSPTVPSSASGSGHRTPTALTARTVRLISLQSAAATADSGTAVETLTDTNGSSVVGEPTTIDVTFSGQNANYLITSNGDGAEGVENRVVDGQLYLYVEGPDLQMHWYHDTSPNAAASMSVPNPRALLEAISPSAGLENLGQEWVGGVELTHLRATTPGSIGNLGIPDVSGNVTSFDVWVDSDNIVRQMAVSSSSGGRVWCVAAPGASGSPPTEWASTACHNLQSHGLSTLPLVSTVDVRFANLGTPETVTAPSGAIDQQGLG